MPLAESYDIPTEIHIRKTDRYIYPGIKTGMSAEEVKNIIHNWDDNIWYSAQLYNSVINVNYFINDCLVQLWIKLPDSLVNEVLKSSEDYSDDVIAEREDEMLRILSENPQGTVVYIIVSR